VNTDNKDVNELLSDKKIHPNANLHKSNAKRTGTLSDSETSDIDAIIQGKSRANGMNGKASKSKIIEDSDEDYDLDNYKF
jgi:hypothetical protein